MAFLSYYLTPVNENFCLIHVNSLDSVKESVTLIFCMIQLHVRVLSGTIFNVLNFATPVSIIRSSIE